MGEVILLELCFALAPQVDLKDISHRYGVGKIVIVRKLFAAFLEDIQTFHRIAACGLVAVVNVERGRPFVRKTILWVEGVDGLEVLCDPADAALFIAEVLPCIKQRTYPDKIAQHGAVSQGQPPKRRRGRQVIQIAAFLAQHRVLEVHLLSKSEQAAQRSQKHQPCNGSP